MSNYSCVCRTVLYHKRQQTRVPSLDWMTFVRPFSYPVWISRLAIVGIFCILMTLMCSNWNIQDGQGSMFMAVIHGSTNQGTPDEPTNSGSRILFFVLYLSSTLIWCFYAATLTSFLTAKKSEALPFVSLEDMLLNNNYRVVTAGSSIYESIFKNGNPVQNKIHDKRMTFRDNIVKSFETMSQSQEDYVTLGDLGTLERLAGDSCNFRRIPVWSFKSFYSFYVQKDSPYRGLFKHL